MKKYALILTAALALFPGYASAHKENLHFAHPLVTESPTPDTKLRLDYIWQRVPGHHEDDGKSDLSTVRVTGEYAFDESTGFEISVPYTWRDPHDSAEENTDHLDNVGMALKYASYRFAAHGIVAGGGLELVLPSGDEEKHIGSDHESEVAPFLSFGYRSGAAQLTGAVEFGFPVNSDHADFEIGWSAAALWSAADRTDVMIEVEGERLYGGEEGGSHAISIAPGAAFAVPGHENLHIGVSTAFPVTDDKEFYIRPMVSLFWHL